VENDRRSAGGDTHTALQISELRSDVLAHREVNKLRFDQLDVAIKELKEAIHEVKVETTDRVDKHEEDEKEYWVKLDTVRRLVWIAVGAITIMSALIAFGLSALDKVLFATQQSTKHIP
jgi:hypothetical protein